ncbi:MAG: DUF2064 domain-containing protein [Elusimicrobiales bacterium]|nr:DUF2064 domain-containing protein [Elusimicrobiales bacterium]
MNRKNAVLFLVTPPVVDFIDSEIKKRFGVERSVNIVKDITIKTYSKIKNTNDDYILLISYFFSKKFPDLRWIDLYEPGYLDVSGLDYQSAVIKSGEYAFRMGAEKVVLINPLCPFIEKSDIISAFSNIKEKQIVIGHASNGGMYLFGSNNETFKVLSFHSPINDSDFDDTIDKTRKNRYLIFEMEPKLIIKDDDSLRRWIESPDFSIDIKIEQPNEHKSHRKRTKETHFHHEHAQDNNGISDINRN